MITKLRIFCARRRAAALVLVLGFVVLLAAMVVAFFATTSSNRRETAQYEAGVTVKQLADTAINVVIGQIGDGTKSWEIPPANPNQRGSGARLTFTTQPGLLRTYDEKGNPGRTFKLYSSDTMVIGPGTEWNVSSRLPSEVPPDWPAKSALYTDLNQPVLVDDPNGKIVRTGSSRKFSAIYPICDPLALLAFSGLGSSTGVEGFDLLNVPGYKTTGSLRSTVSETLDPTASAELGKTNNPAPMPVQWIYVLQDGTLTSPASVSADGLTVDWSNLPDTSPSKPRKANPIIGRIAFWTDDETCKLNVNTASEPTPWDTPRAICIQDLNYGLYQPAQKEYQRFSGHPYMTALSPVFYPNTPAKILTNQQRQAIYDLIPRVQYGGSEAGTKAIGRQAPVIPDSDRLFANADEFVFNATATTPRTGSTLPGSGGNPVPMDATMLRRARFFLTANSRAPEVNLFGLPRVSLWAENVNTGLRSAYDRLAAFCATIGDASTPKLFYFQRSDPWSPTKDWTDIPRNQELYNFLKTLTSADIPGFGGSFQGKWSGDRDQVLTEIFDYARSANLRDRQTGGSAFAPNGQVAPIRIDNTKGFGRFHTISQFGLHFVCSQDWPSSADAEQGDAGGRRIDIQKGERAIEAGMIFEPFTPSQGFFVLQENMAFEVSMTPMSVDGTDLEFPAGPIRVGSGGGFAGGWHGRNWGGSAGIRSPIQNFGGRGYPFISKRVKVTVSDSKKTMRFSGGQITVNIYSRNAVDPANLVQTITASFPAGDFPIPTLVQTGTEGYRGAGPIAASGWWTISNRYANSGACPHAPGDEYADPARRWHNSSGPPGFKQGGIFRAEDVVRTIVPPNGDIRLIAGRTTVDPSFYVKGAFYDDTTRNIDHLFTDPEGTGLHYGFGNEPGLTSNTGDQLTPAIYHFSRNPKITPGAGKTFNKWNDFDNGSAHITDGAYINKPDEGNFTRSFTYAYFSWNFSEPSEVIFSPNRLFPSPGMLGSLPTGVLRNQPWQTLLFRPQTGHPGEGSPVSGPPYTTPPDHAIMDLFWIPIVEPYSISEPFSTAGKVNLNYEIAPFSYIRRATALHGVFKSEEPLLLPTNNLGPQSPNGVSKIYKLWDHQANDWPSLPNGYGGNPSKDEEVRFNFDKAFNAQPPYDQMRRPIDMARTLEQADTRFTSGKAFRSASQVCELHLVRDGETLRDYLDNKIWPNNLVTGENTREKPYTNLYSRLTTKSNVFTVHMRVQTLRKRPGADASYSVWQEGSDSITSEHRGSALIERYVDQTDPKLPDFAKQPDTTLDSFYRFRIINTKKFVP